MLTEITDKIEKIFNNGISPNTLNEAKNIFNEGWCQVLSRSKNGIDILVQTDEEGNQSESRGMAHE